MGKTDIENLIRRNQRYRRLAVQDVSEHVATRLRDDDQFREQFRRDMNSGYARYLLLGVFRKHSPRNRAE